MKRTLLVLATALAAFSAIFAEVEVYTGQPTVQGESYLLANWNFNDEGGEDHEALLTASRGLGRIEHSFNPASVASFAGSTMNSFGGDPAGGSLSLQGGADLGNNGANVTFALSTVGFSDLVLTYATRGTASGFGTHSWQYSIDGVSFTDFELIMGRNSTSFSVQTVDFSAVSELNAAEEVFIRVVLDGATNSNGNNRIDNVQFRATALDDTFGPGSAVLINATNGSAYNGKGLFAVGTTQAVALSFAGTGPEPIRSVAVSLPDGWSGLALGNVSLGGSGFGSASASVSGNTVTISNADVTDWSAGTLIMENLNTPAEFEIRDWGRFAFTVETAMSGKELAAVRTEPSGRLVLPISMVRQVNAQGTPLGLGQQVAVSGVATVDSGLFSTTRFSTYLQDETGGVAIDYDPIGDIWSGALAGVRYTAIGTVGQFYGRTEISLTGQDGFIDHGFEGTPEPRVVTIEELLENAEELEGTLIRLPRVSKVSGSWAYYGEDADLILGVAGSAENLGLRLNRFTDLSWNPEPSYPVDLVGIFNQFTRSNPPLDGYHILPRSYSDFLPPAEPGDGSGAALIANAAQGSPHQGTSRFDGGDGQSVSLTFLGETDGFPLANISVTMPEGWSGLSPGNVGLSGAGFSSATVSVAGDTLTIANASVTASAAGTIFLNHVTMPEGEEIPDFGAARFLVKTAREGRELNRIAVQPQANLVLPISLLRTVDGRGVPLALDRQVVVEGVATVSSGVFNQTRLSSYIQDETAGIALDHPRSNEFWDPPVAGGRYVVTGTVTQFNGLTQLVPAGQAELMKLGTETIPEPRLLTIDQLLAAAEQLEGTLIRIPRVIRANSAQEWPSEGQYANISVTDPGGGSLTLRINQFTDITWNSEPEFPLDLVGVLTQYDSSSPYTSGYQILPRSYADFLPASEASGGFPQWQEEFFPGADPALSGPAADPDGDGLVNLLEFAFGGNPHENSRHLLPKVAAHGDFLQITFRRTKAAEDLIYRVEASPDLITWTAIWSSLDHVYDSGEPVIEETITDDSPLDELSRRFLRLVVSEQ